MRPMFVAALSLAVACAGSTPKPESACRKPSAGPQRLLRFMHTLRPAAAALDAGRYRFVLAGESYTAACDLFLPSERDKLAGNSEWTAACDGDDVEVDAVFDRLVGLLVPARLTTVSVRVSRGDAVILESVVTPNTACGPDPLEPSAPSAAEGDPGRLCLILAGETTTRQRRAPAPAAPTIEPSSRPQEPCLRRASGGPWRELRFDRPGRPWFNSFDAGEYRFQVDGDQYAAVCTLSVPGDRDVSSRCEGDELDFLVNNSIQAMLIPARLRSVRVRITRNGAPLFSGLITPSTSCQAPGAARSPDGFCVSMTPSPEIQ